MRLKFRAFYKPNEKMYEVLTLDIIGEKALIENNDDPNIPLRGYAKLNTMKLMQSTGFTDKNGKEIFEGDICYWRDAENFDGEVIEDTFEVMWSDEFLKWVAVNGYGVHDLYDFADDRELKVIGDIYRNKDLLGD